MKIGIVGAGVFGTSVAWAAAKRGYQVDLYERDTIPSPRAASNDISKATRLEYGALTPRYAPLVQQAFELWIRAEELSDRKFFHQTGVLALAREFKAGGFEYDSWKHLKELGYTTEIIDPEEGKKRFPFFNWDRLELGVHNPLGGWLRSDVATQSLARCAELAGATVHLDTPVASVDEGRIRSALGERSYDLVVVTAGAWVAELLPQFQTTARVSRQRMTYYRPQMDFATPVWLHDPARSGWYGFPKNSDGIVKVALHRRAETVGADDSRQIDQAFLDESRDFVREMLPMLPPDSLEGGKCCFYTNSPNGDLVIERLSDKLLVAGLGSGHGFKFGPVLGELALDELERGEGHFRLQEACDVETW